MNLVLVDPEELAPGGTCVLRDRRAQHLRSVLGALPGAHVRAGVVGGGLGRAEVISDDGVQLTLRLAVTEPASAPLPIELVLAIPRPKVLARVIEAAASFGVARVALTNAWRVDKSYLDSPRLAPDALALAARLGAEQGATTHVPAIAVHRRLMSLLDARWPLAPLPDAPLPDALRSADGAPLPDAPTSALPPDAPRPALPPDAPKPAMPPDAPAETRLIAHPGAPPIEAVVTGAAGPIVLAIGPEGGWIDRELATFVARGFAPVALGAPILRVETAVAAAIGQLLLLARLRATA